MSDQAAHLVDRVLPRAPVRQWVLSVPKRVRYHLARSGELKREALGIFLGEVFAGVRARVPFGREGRTGAVTVVQRFGSARFVRLPDGRIAYGLRRPWRDGTSHVVLTPLELMEKLAALVPRPWEHGVHCHGVLAPNARMREEIVPRVDREPESPPRGRGRLGLDWATLLRRSFEVDVLRCPKCGGRMRWVECVTRPERIRAELQALGEAEEAPALCPARGPPQGEFEWTSEGEIGL